MCLSVLSDFLTYETEMFYLPCVYYSEFFATTRVTNRFSSIVACHVTKESKPEKGINNLEFFKSNLKSCTALMYNAQLQWAKKILYTRQS